jgi:DNA-binding MarR family transcriptional regulator
VSAAQLFVLRALEGADDMSVSQLAEQTLTDRSSVASVVDRLIDAKLVSRVTSASDRRRAAISITAKGRNVLKKAPAAPTNMLIDGLRALSGPEIRALSASLTRLVEAMGLEKGPAYMLFEEGPKKARR